MVKEIFIGHSFSQEMRMAGDILIGELDKSEAQVQAAFWILEDNEKKWELNLISPLVDTEGARNFYKRIDDTNQKISQDEGVTISLHDIRVSSLNRKLKALVDNGPFMNALINQKKLGKDFIPGVNFEDMYVYRMPLFVIENQTQKISA